MGEGARVEGAGMGEADGPGEAGGLADGDGAPEGDGDADGVTVGEGDGVAVGGGGLSSPAWPNSSTNTNSAPKMNTMAATQTRETGSSM